MARPVVVALVCSTLVFIHFVLEHVLVLTWHESTPPGACIIVLTWQASTHPGACISTDLAGIYSSRSMH